MQSDADSKRALAQTAATEANQVDFTSIFDALEVLITDAEENQGDGSELVNWLANLNFDGSAWANICNSKAITLDQTTLVDGSKVWGYAQGCQLPKKIWLQVIGGTNVDWEPYITEETEHSKRTCSVFRNKKKCVYEINPDLATKFAFAVSPAAGNLQITHRLKNDR